MALLEHLANRKLLVVTGKGGVGKTVISAALGSLLSQHGRRVLMLEVDPRENLHQVFDVPPSGGEIVSVAGDTGAHISLQNLQPRLVIEELVHQHLKLGIVSRRVTGSPVFEHFVEGAPGLKELAVLSHAQRMVTSSGHNKSRFDVVVLDAPATGHGISLLAAPQLVSEVIVRGPIGAEARELAGFVADPLSTGIVAVTLAEEMPAQETIELREALLAKVGRTPELLVINALYPQFPTSTEAGAGESDTDRFLLELWRLRRQVNDREISRLAAAWQGATLQLPMLPADRGPRLLAGLRQRILEQARHVA